MTRYALQHRGTGAFLAVNPCLDLDPGAPRPAYATTPEPADACSWSTMTGATLAALALEDFRGAWDVVAVDVPSIYDDPEGVPSETEDA